MVPVVFVLKFAAALQAAIRFAPADVYLCDEHTFAAVCDNGDYCYIDSFNKVLNAMGLRIYINRELHAVMLQVRNCNS